MATTRPSIPTTRHSDDYREASAGNEANSSGVSWGAVVGGAFVTAALSLILLALGAGLGLSSVSPWAGAGVSAATFGSLTIVWLVVLQIMSSSMGGYLAGRLRTKWVSIHSDEVYFRDTAHGFLAWAVALVLTAGFLTAAAATMVGSSPRLSASGSGTTTSAANEADPNAYFIDTMFRSDRVRPAAEEIGVRSEAERIFANALKQGSIPAADKTYLAQLIGSTTGIRGEDAARRESDAFAQAQQQADAARKLVAHSLLWTFLALLIGAFCSSFAATIGGGQRDRVVVV